MKFRCMCGNEFRQKYMVLEHCALLTPGWPRVSIWTNGKHRPDEVTEARWYDIKSSTGGVPDGSKMATSKKH